VALASAPTRELRSRFIGQRLDSNGQMAAFAERSNYVKNDRWDINQFMSVGDWDSPIFPLIWCLIRERSNYVKNDSYAIGCASQDYITNTHSKYYPGPQDKLLSIQLGVPNQSMVRPVPEVG
jgi:hypothetical protein